VRITRPFYLGVTEVTQAQYQAVMGLNPSDFSASGGQRDAVAGQSTANHPVERVSWFDAVRFCNALSAKEGLKPFYEIDGNAVRVSDWNGPGYRLPTEAEWEYACRAGSATAFGFGDDETRLGDFAWFIGNSGGKTHPVGQKGPNALGLYDMHGNVWEWCWDGYDEQYFAPSPVEDPSGPPKTALRVIRGGCWRLAPLRARSACRLRNPPGNRVYVLGFRVARTPSRS
jgi:formylglycine-generating enzyme required for sulfatase activity